jgi:hypothetical protein
MPTRQQEQMWKAGSTMTNVEHYAAQMDDRPFISTQTLKSLSKERQMMLESDINNGEFQGTSKSARAGVVAVSGGMIKTASPYSLNDFTGGGGNRGSGGYAGSGNTVELTPQIYSPFIQNQNMNLPRTKDLVNAWARAFFILNPVVQNAINLHTFYPISKLSIKCKNKKAENFFGDMIDELNLLNVCLDIAQSYWLLGEAFPYAEWDEMKGTWSRLFLQNPDYVIVKKTLGPDPDIFIKLDESLKTIINSNKKSDVQEREKLPRYVIEAAKRGENIKLHNFNISQISRVLDSSNVRGTGLVNSVFKQLMLMDLIRESEYVQFQDMINPMMMISVGSTDARLGPDALEAYRQIFEQAMYNKNFKIITHDAVKVEMIAKGSGIYDTSTKYTQLMKELYTGLMVPEVIITGGTADISYANGGISLDVLKQRYMTFRNVLTKWLRRKIFAPVAYAHDFYENKDGELHLIVPDIEWNHLSLFDTDNYISSLKDLSAEGEGKRVSRQTLYRSLGLELEDEERKMRQERVLAAIAKKEAAALEGMSLSKLRTINDDTEIVEDVNTETGDPIVGSPSGGLPGVGGGSSGLGGPPGGPSEAPPGGLPGPAPEGENPPPPPPGI